MPDAALLALFAAAALALAAAPGPDIIYVITRAIAEGARASVVAAAGLATGILVHTAFCALGISALLAASETAFTIIKFIGAAYLIYLGIRMCRDRSAATTPGPSEPKSLSVIYRQSIIMNVLNPKVALFFLAFLPQFVDPQAGPVAGQLVVLGLIFMIITFAVMSLAGLVSARVGTTITTRFDRANRLRYIPGFVLIGLGLRLALDSRS